MIRTLYKFVNENEMMKNGVKRWMLSWVIILSFVAGFFVVALMMNKPKVLSVETKLDVFSGEINQVRFKFNRVMDRKSVEENFWVEPEVLGKVNWFGNVMVFGPDEFLRRGRSYKFGFKDGVMDGSGELMEKFSGFEIDLPLLKILTLEDLGGVSWFRVYELGEGGDMNFVKFVDDVNLGKRIVKKMQYVDVDRMVYFLGRNVGEDVFQLYRYEFESKKIVQLTKGLKFDNLNFKVSNDGELVAVSRVEKNLSGDNLSRVEVWMGKIDELVRNGSLRKVANGNAVGLQFAFTPDGSGIVYRNEAGNFELSEIGLNEPIFIGDFSEIYGFHPMKPEIYFTKFIEGDVFSLNNQLFKFNGNGETLEIKFSEEGIFKDLELMPNGKGFWVSFSGNNDEVIGGDSFYPMRIYSLMKYDFLSGKSELMFGKDGFSEEKPKISFDGSKVLVLRYEVSDAQSLMDAEYRDLADGVGELYDGGEVWVYDVWDGSFRNLDIKARQVEFMK